MFVRLTLVALLFLIPSLKAQQQFDISTYYQRLASSNLALVDMELNNVKQIPSAKRDAYEGALLMKKAGLEAGPAKKLKLFKSGHTKLENAINKDTSNGEYRFLRLIIQENAPKIVNYRSELGKDAAYLRKNFQSFPKVIRQEIIKYSKTSGALKKEELNGTGND